MLQGDFGAHGLARHFGTLADAVHAPLGQLPAERVHRIAEHSVMAMITSAANPPRPLDCPMTDLASAGLTAPSNVRFKLFTLDHRLVRGQLGRLCAADEQIVRQGLARLFGTP